MAYRCAILDDYQNCALQVADWSVLGDQVETKAFTEWLGGSDNVIKTLQGFDMVCLMRERTLFDRKVIEALPSLKLIITCGMRNAAIDVAAAKERGIPTLGTESAGFPTAELAIGIMLELARKIGWEDARMKTGHLWQKTLGIELEGKTLGVLGLGKLGGRTARIAKAIGMRVIAWSQNLTAEKCKEYGAELVSKEDLFRQSDFLTIHLVLSARSRGLVGAQDLALMKKTAFLVNTSRGPIVDEDALLKALQERRIGGAGLDVFATEPLPLDHPVRKLDNVVLTPHLGYVTDENYRRYYGGMVEDIRSWLDGKPVRVMSA
ncbi:MAG: D-2-hydroxyacid dehydrogenase family protein [Rhizobiales bacterium]|nr:D-2-hydroxyacid dehydrogenase family protein [Hyphomicrobiales bacterium]